MSIISIDTDAQYSFVESINQLIKLLINKTIFAEIIISLKKNKNKQSLLSIVIITFKDPENLTFFTLCNLLFLMYKYSVLLFIF